MENDTTRANLRVWLFCRVEDSGEGDFLPLTSPAERTGWTEREEDVCGGGLRRERQGR